MYKNLEVTISKGNSKLGEIANVSLYPGIDCVNGRLCHKTCYARRALRYPETRNAWERNSILARSDLVNYMHQIMNFLHTYKGDFFRWHVGGDILSPQYLDKMASIARSYPAKTFLTFTKAFNFLPKYAGMLPGNLRIVLSRWPGDRDPGLDSYSQAWLDIDHYPSNAIHCIGKCDECLACFERDLTRDVVLKLH